MTEAPTIPGPEDPEAALAAVVALRRLASQLEVLATVEAMALAHVVAAVSELERGTAARALSILGGDRDSLRDAAREEAGPG